ncbi:hypothetical protein ACFQ5N_08360 [Lutibacter holmesii]|uniref:HNH endonuclease n=1 Tax=Lutibacter holmesii TaxID=1137985 RepID=A0ABW3WNN7_9FLAO
MNKICVFCGNKPNKKNKEHVLPQWLLRMTGDPNRVVQFGYDYIKKKDIIFNWKNFTSPSCTKCNDKYADFEGIVSPIIDKLSKKSEITSTEAIMVLDWLDKVRIGLWINYYYLENNKAQIEPKLCIDNRLGKKDRFMQIHFLESNNKSEGLNAFGVETFAFQVNPSCFALRINNILIINGSNDFLISQNCGFPYPNKMEFTESGILSLSDWKYDRETKPEITNLKLHKGVLTIYQPIHSQLEYETNYFNDSYLIQHCINREKRIGTLFRIKNNKIQPIYDLSKKLDYESVKGLETKYIGELVSKVYKGQNIFLLNQTSDKEGVFSKIIELNKQYIDFYKKYHHKKNFA